MLLFRISKIPKRISPCLQFQILLEPFLWKKNDSSSKVSDASVVERWVYFSHPDHQQSQWYKLISWVFTSQFLCCSVSGFFQRHFGQEVCYYLALGLDWNILISPCTCTSCGLSLSISDHYDVLWCLLLLCIWFVRLWTISLTLLWLEQVLRTLNPSQWATLHLTWCHCFKRLSFYIPHFCVPPYALWSDEAFFSRSVEYREKVPISSNCAIFSHLKNTPKPFSFLLLELWSFACIILFLINIKSRYVIWLAENFTRKKTVASLWWECLEIYLFL